MVKRNQQEHIASQKQNKKCLRNLSFEWNETCKLFKNEMMSSRYEISAAVIDQFYKIALNFCLHVLTFLFQASKWSLACEEHAVIICRCVFIHFSSFFARISSHRSVRKKMGYGGSQVGCILSNLIVQTSFSAASYREALVQQDANVNEVSCCCEKWWK